MALKTNIPGPRGEEATYTRIASFFPHFVNKTTEVALYSYTDKQERLNYEAAPLTFDTITFGTANHIDRVLETRDEIYEELTTATYKVEVDGELVDVPKYPKYFGAEIA